MNPKQIQILKGLVFAKIELTFNSWQTFEEPFVVIATLNELSDIYYQLNELNKK